MIRSSRPTSETCSPAGLLRSRGAAARATLAAALLAALPPALVAQQSSGDSARAAAPADSTATLAGKVVSAMTGGPLANARVVLVESGYGAFTDSAGDFRVPNVPAGLDTVQVSLIGFAEAKAPLLLQAGATTRATFLLSQTVLKVEELHVEVRAPRARGKIAQFEEHRKYGQGFYITPEMIEDRHPQHPSDLLRMVPGVEVSAYQMGGASVRITRSSLNCTPPIFVDGLLSPNLQIDEINRDDIMAVEVYRGPSETPPEYMSASNRCGAIVVWTQSGGTRSGSPGG